MALFTVEQGLWTLTDMTYGQEIDLTLILEYSSGSTTPEGGAHLLP